MINIQMESSSPDIALFSSTMGDGGAQRTVANLAKGFAEKGYNVDLLLIDCSGPYLQSIPESVNLIELEADRALTSIPPIVRYLREKEPKILFSTMEYMNVVAVLSCFISNSSTEVVIRAANVRSKDSQQGIKEKVQHQLATRLYPQASKIIALSNYVKKDMETNYCIEGKHISVIYNPVVISEIQRKSQEKIGEDLIDTKSELILSVGSLTKQKDMSTTVRAFAHLTEERDVELVILGEGEQRKRLIQLAEDLEIADRVHMPGFVNNPFAFMNIADTFVLSSRWEGFGHVIVEAMTCGTPIVATDCPGGPSEILNDGEYGELVPVGDEKALATAIKRTLENPLDESILIERARDFDYKRISLEYERLLFDV